MGHRRMLTLAAMLLAALPAAHVRAQAPDQPPPETYVTAQVVSVSGTTLKLKVGRAIRDFELAPHLVDQARRFARGTIVEARVEAAPGGGQRVLGFRSITPPGRNAAGGTAPPSPGPATRRTPVLITCDLECEVSIDFTKVAVLPAGGHVTLQVEPGERLVSARSPDGRAFRDKVTISDGSKVIDILLAKAPLAAPPERFDPAAAAVVLALLDVSAAGGHVAWVLEKKAFGFHDVDLTVGLQSAQGRLAREAAALQALGPQDPARQQLGRELARAAEEAATFVQLLTQAVTTAQQQGTTHGAAAQQRAQALARQALMTPAPAALAVLQASTHFAGAIPSDRRPAVGLPAVSDDFALGADYDASQGAPRLGAVARGGLAEALGLRPGDRILAVAAAPVADAWAFKRALRANAGRSVELTLEREGRQHKRKVSVPASLPR